MEKDYIGLLNKFLDEYKDDYNLKELKEIRNLLLNNSFDNPNLFINNNELVQIYTKLGFYDSKQDSFFHMNLKKLRENFNLGCNILEISGGPLAVFSNLIACEQQKIGNGTVSVYDPRLILKSIDYPNVIPYKKKITSAHDFSPYDLIVGIYPCQATELLIENACIYNKDFYVALCGCEHYPDNSYYSYSEDAPFYYDYVIHLASLYVDKYDNGELIIDNFDSDIYSYPILYNKKEKKF